jgi:hypothetical protein
MPSPSIIHEGVIELVRHEPTFAASLLRDLFGVAIPPFDAARLAEAGLNQVMPVEYAADAVVLFDNTHDKQRPVFGTIFEVQLERKERKRYTWPLYAMSARARHECPFVVAAVTADQSVARWAAQPIDLGDGMSFRVRVIGPDCVPKLTDPQQALREPHLSVLSAVVHGGGAVDTAASIARAAFRAIQPLPSEQRVLYSILIEKALSAAAREVLAMETDIKKYFTETHWNSYNRGHAEGEAQGKAEGKTEGKAEGEARALLLILKRRGLVLTPAQQQVIAGCTDLATLDRWLERAVSAASWSELVA